MKQMFPSYPPNNNRPPVQIAGVIVIAVSMIVCGKFYGRQQLKEKKERLVQIHGWIHNTLRECQLLNVPAGAPNVYMCIDGTSYRSLTLDDMVEVKRCEKSIDAGNVKDCERIPAVPAAVKWPDVAR